MNSVKKSRGLKVFVSIFFVLTFVINCLRLEIWADDLFPACSLTSYEMVLDNDSEINSFLYDKYSEYDDVVITDVIYHNPLDTNNYSQATLNAQYNVYSDKHHSGIIQNTCSELAIALVNEYMLRKGIVSWDGTNNDIDSIFYRVCGVAKDEGWDRDGTTASKIDDYFTAAMDYYSPKYKGDYSTLLMHQKYMDSYYAGIPVMVSIPGHTICGVGILEKNVTYTKKGLFGSESTKTELETFLIINDGWSGENDDNYIRYTYVSFEYVNSIVVPVRK